MRGSKWQKLQTPIEEKRKESWEEVHKKQKVEGINKGMEEKAEKAMEDNNEEQLHKVKKAKKRQNPRRRKRRRSNAEGDECKAQAKITYNEFSKAAVALWFHFALATHPYKCFAFTSGDDTLP